MSARNIKNTIQHIKDSIDIVQVIGKYVDLKPKGGKYWGLSPFKNEKTPSFCVDPEKKFYYCFSTSQGGNVFKFIEEIEHVDFRESVRVLARELGLNLDVSNPEITTRSTVDNKILDLCARIEKTFSFLLWQKEGTEALTYIKERGIVDQTLKNFHIGYAPNKSDWLYNFLSTKGYREEELRESGLFSKKYPKYSLFRNRLIFPILSATGQALGYGGRILYGEGPKYINSPETKFYKKKQTLYGLYQSIENKGFKNHKKAYLVEGYLDVMAMHQVGVDATVAPLGTAFMKEQAQLLRRLTDTIVLVYDNDESGLQATFKSAMLCEQVLYKSIRVVELSGNDPAEILKLYGGAELSEQLLAEEDFYNYYINKIFPGNNASVQVREESIRKIVEYIEVVESDYKRAMYISQTADLFRISANVIEKIIMNGRKKKNSLDMYETSSQYEYSSNTEFVKIIPSIVNNGELLAIAAMCALIDTEKELFENFRTSVRVSDLDDLNARAIYQIMEILHRKGELNFTMLLQSLEEHLSQYLHSVLASGEASTHAKKIILDFVKQIKIKRLKKRSKDIEHQLRVYTNRDGLKMSTHTKKNMIPIDNVQSHDAPKTENLLKELLLEKKFINNEITRLNILDKH